MYFFFGFTNIDLDWVLFFYFRKSTWEFVNTARKSTQGAPPSNCVIKDGFPGASGGGDAPTGVYPVTPRVTLLSHIPNYQIFRNLGQLLDARTAI